MLSPPRSHLVRPSMALGIKCRSCSSPSLTLTSFFDEKDSRAPPLPYARPSGLYKVISSYALDNQKSTVCRSTI